VKTERKVVLRRLSATAGRYIVYFSFCIPVRSCENQGGPYQYDNYCSSSRKVKKKLGYLKAGKSKYPYVSYDLGRMHSEVVFLKDNHLHSKMSS